MPTPETLAARLDDPDEPGSPKMAVLRAALAVRARRPEAFGESASYDPVAVAGSKADHVVAFTRSAQVATVVPRLTVSLAGDWCDTKLTLPPGRWRNQLTGGSLSVRGGAKGGSVAVARLLAEFPVALLVRDQRA